MKITLLVNDLSENGMYRTLNLARIIKRYYEVEIVGPRFGRNIYNPFAGEEFDIKEIKGCNFPCFFSSIKKILSSISGDIIYAHHPIFTSYGVGLIDRLRSQRPIVIDIDDWPVGHWLGENSRGLRSVVRRFKNLLRVWDPTSPFYSLPTSLFLAKYADEITVTSHFLQTKFGGTMVRHAQDLDLFDPSKYDRHALRGKLGINNEKIILFLGTPHPYKGVDDIVQSVKRIGGGVSLLLVGARQTDYVSRLKEMSGGQLRTVESCLYSQVPEYLSIADLIVIPQRHTPVTQAQVPAKLIDAMAMAKPIITSDVSDMPEIMQDCGLTYLSGDIDDLTKKISALIDDPEYASTLGERARSKCESEFSYDAVGVHLKNIFDGL